jgi:uncharacterized protein with von Willebrand factor type A (vWA) domain
VCSANLDDRDELAVEPQYEAGAEAAFGNLRVTARRISNWTSTDTIRSYGRERAISTSKPGRERRNAVKVILFLDVGGSMDDHIKVVEELFSAAMGRVQASGILLFPQLPV